MTTIGITGANGFLGAAFKDALVGAGYAVVSFVRAPKQGERFFDLASMTRPDLSGIDVLVHCAWDLSESSWDKIAAINVEGSSRLLEAAREQGIVIIFISSMAAFEGCGSMYGRSKLQVEEIVKDASGIVIRPGTVYGGAEGGIVKAISGLLRKFHVAPLIGGGRHTLYAVHVEDLCAFLCEVIEKRTRLAGAVLAGAHSHAVTLRDFFASIAKMNGITAFFIPVPAILLYMPLRFLEILGIKPPLRSDSVVSITQGARKVVLKLPEGMQTCFRSIL